MPCRIIEVCIRLHSLKVIRPECSARWNGQKVSLMNSLCSKAWPKRRLFLVGCKRLEKFTAKQLKSLNEGNSERVQRALQPVLPSAKPGLETRHRPTTVHWPPSLWIVAGKRCHPQALQRPGRGRHSGECH